LDTEVSKTSRTRRKTRGNFVGTLQWIG